MASPASTSEGAPVPARAERPPSPTFSIVIPTYNEARDIEATLRCAFAQTQAPTDVVVVDGGSADGTAGIVRRLAAGRLPIELIEESGRRGVAAARNEGIRRATGDVVVVLNADVLLPPDFLEQLAPLYSGAADYVSVEARVANLGSMFGRYSDALHLLRYGRDYHGWTEGFSCRREAALGVGFPEEIPGAGGEDVEFVDRLGRAGYRGQMERSISVRHVVPDTLSGFWSQYAGRGPAVPHIERRLRHKSRVVVVARRTVAAVRTIAVTATIVPQTLTAVRLARRSRCGLRDAPAFWVLHHLLFIALRCGEWQTLREMARDVSSSHR